MDPFKRPCPHVFSGGGSKVFATPMEYATQVIIINNNIAAEAVFDHTDPKLWDLFEKIASSAVIVMEGLEDSTPMDERRLLNMMHIRESIKAFLTQWHIEVTEAEAQAELSLFLEQPEVPA